MAKRKRKKATKAKSTRKAGRKKKKRPIKKTARRNAAKPKRREPAKRADARRAGGAVAAGPAAARLVDVEVEKTSDSPDLVRITIEGTSRVVLAPGEKQGSVAEIPVESFVRLWIEVAGNPGETATINVTRATPRTLRVTIPNNTGQWAESQSILVTG